MQLSSKARKAVAVGLAISTFLWSAVIVVTPFASAAVHSDGCIVLSGGTVWLITGGTRRGFTSAEVFASSGYNFSQVVTASAEDVALPVGPIMTYADGTLVMGPGDPLVYLVANGQKRGFTTGSVFTGLGYSFSNIQVAPANTFADLPTGANLDSTAIAHPDGTLVNASGTIYQMTPTGKLGVPSMVVFNSLGLKLSHAVAANSYDTAAASEGVLTERVLSCGTAPVPVGSVNITLSGPASSTLIIDTTATGDNYSQATAPLANFVFSGSGTVTGVTLKRLGVSADDIVNNLYLFDGETRITDGASFSSGIANFTNVAGLFTVSGSKTIGIRADLNDGAYSGQTLGVELTTVTLSSGSVGGLPVASNLHSTASASLASVSLGAITPGTTTTDPGKDIKVWESTFTVTTRDVNMTRLALRQINSILTADINNFRLLVDGTQVATTASIDANGYVTFSGFNKALLTGNRIVKVLADVIGGSSRIIQMSLRNKGDINLVDSQYGVNVSAIDTFPASTGIITVNPGTMTVQKASDSPSGNVPDGASSLKVAKWTFTAYGEPIKVETLLVDFTHVTSGDVGEDSTLQNGKIFVNNSQVGSTTTLDPATTGTSFNTNFTVTPGTPATVEVYSDMVDNDGSDAVSAGDKITFTLSTQTGNGSRQVSLGTVDVPTSNSSANQVIIASGSMVLAAATNYTSHNITVPKTNYKVGSWTLTGGSTEDVNVSTLSLDTTQSAGGTDFDDDNLQDCYMNYGASQTTVKSTMTGTDDDWSVSFLLAKNTVMTLDLFCNIVDPESLVDNSDALVTDLSVSGTGAVSAGSVTQLDKDGQTLTKQAGSLTEAIGASNPVIAISEDNVTKQVAAFKWTASNESYKLTEVIFDINAVTTVTSVILKDSAGNTLGTRPAAAVDTTFSGLSVPIGVGETVELKVEMQLGAVGTGAGTSREDVAVTLDSYKKTDSQGVETSSDVTVAGNSQFVFKAIPVVTAGVVITTSPSNSEMEVFKFTVGATGGPIAVKQFGFKVSLTDNTDDTLLVGSFKLFRHGTDITDSVQIVDGDGASVETGGSDVDETGTGTDVTYVYVTFGSVSSDIFVGEEQIPTSYTYSLRATAGAFDSADDDSFKVEMLADTATTSRYLNDDDVTDGQYIATLSNAAGTGGILAQPIYLLWSDISAVPHDADVDDDEGGDIASQSTADWSNGYLVKSLPFSAVTFTY